MAEKAKAMVAGAKRGMWRYFGAMMMEQKDGIQAVSYTRTLGLILFGMCAYKWSMGIDVVESMLMTLWGLIGIKGAKDVAAAFRK